MVTATTLSPPLQLSTILLSLNSIPSSAIFVQKRELCVSVLCSFKDWATTNLLMNKLRRFVIKFV